MNGTETVAWRYGVPTYKGGAMAWFVPTASGDPEHAVAFFDLMYNDPVVANLVINGIEGENYVLDGELAKYPDGADTASNSYSRQTWAWPNQQIGYDWTNGLYYLTKTKYYTIQVLLNAMRQDLQVLLTSSFSGASNVDITSMPSTSIKMAIAVVGAIPVLCIYPFIQKYFVKGITVGAVKG